MTTPGIKTEGLSKRYLMPIKSNVPTPHRRLLFRGTQRPDELIPQARYSRHPQREVWALRDVSFSAKAGAITAVIGSNGAGKTTLLKVLAGVTYPTSGRAQLCGRAAMLGLHTRLNDDRTARDNVKEMARLMGKSQEEARERTERIVEFAGIERFVDAPLKHFSTGMYMKFAFSLALNLDPEIVLADEALAVGDIAFQQRCLRALQEAAQNGATVLLVSHDMNLVARMCEHAVWLHGGRVILAGDTQSVIGAYEEDVWTHVTENTDELRSPLGEYLGLESPLIRSHGTAAAVDVNNDGDIKIKILARVDVPGTTIRYGAKLYSGSKAVLRSYSPATVIERQGPHSATVRIPLSILRNRVYTANIGMILSRGGQDYWLIRKHALAFRGANEEGQAPALLIEETRASLTTFQLQWSDPIASDA